MLVLRVDPWQAEYGASVEIEEGGPEPAVVDAFAESTDWSRGVAPAAVARPEGFYFVDGVRRIDLRVIADRPDGGTAFGLFGSYGVGAVACFGRAEFADARVERALVMGTGVLPDPVAVSVGRHLLRYDPLPVPGSEIIDPLHGLQGRMRSREAALAAEIAGRNHAPVVLDGPLSVFTPAASPAGAPVIGYIKRQARAYLAGEQQQLLARLNPGERTPIFGLGQRTLDRYAWYVRLAPRRMVEHPLSGIARCEVLTSVGLEEARRLADVTAAVLPAFASAAGHDPRAPQNLYPVGALEARLRHHLGDAVVIRRALETLLFSRVQG